MTGEGKSRIEPFAKAKNMTYPLATGFKRGGAYSPRGIPHCWLISASGKILYKGHPGSLQDSVIEKALEDVALPPKLTLGETLEKKVRSNLTKLYLAKVIKALAKYDVEGDENQALAAGAIKDLEAYGAKLIARAQREAQQGNYHRTVEFLERCEKQFKGHELGGKAKAKLKELSTADETKLEIEAAKTVLKAEAYAAAGATAKAQAMLRKVTASKRMAETRMRVIAERFASALK